MNIRRMWHLHSSLSSQKKTSPLQDLPQHFLSSTMKLAFLQQTLNPFVGLASQQRKETGILAILVKKVFASSGVLTSDLQYPIS